MDEILKEEKGQLDISIPLCWDDCYPEKGQAKWGTHLAGLEVV